MVVGVPLRHAPVRRSVDAQAAHAESRFGYIPFSPAKVEAIIARIVARPAQSACILATRGGDVVGMPWCSVGEYHIGSDVLLTTIHNLNVAKPLRATLVGGRVTLGLLRRAEAWSRAKGAREMLFHVTSGVETARTERMMRKLGYEAMGGNYGKWLCLI